MGGLQRVPLIGRKFAKNQAGVFVPPKKVDGEKILGESWYRSSHPPATKVIPLGDKPPSSKAKTKRRAANKRARKARRMNRG
jgi:hypothetical protein